MSGSNRLNATSAEENSRVKINSSGSAMSVPRKMPVNLGLAEIAGTLMLRSTNAAPAIANSGT